MTDAEKWKWHKTHMRLSTSMAPHSSTLAWKIPWMEEPGGLQTMGLLRDGHDWATSLSLFTFLHWRRKWQPTPVFLPGESQGRGSLVGCHLWGCTGSDTTEVTAAAAVSHCSLLTGADVQISGPNCISWSLVLDRKMSSSCTLRVRLDFRKPSVFVFCCCVTGHHALGRYRAQVP